MFSWVDERKSFRFAAFALWMTVVRIYSRFCLVELALLETSSLSSLQVVKKVET